jgi:hypothetical protein
MKRADTLINYITISYSILSGRTIYIRSKFFGAKSNLSPIEIEKKTKIIVLPSLIFELLITTLPLN